jgi:hypothetical protein
MSKFEKVLKRLKTKPSDFTWHEVKTIFSHFGYVEIKGSGSRRKFYSPKSKAIISLHEPHPSPIIKHYVINLIIEHFKEEGLI